MQWLDYWSFINVAWVRFENWLDTIFDGFSFCTLHWGFSLFTKNNSFVLIDIQYCLAHLLVFRSKGSFWMSFFIQWREIFSESARNLVQHVDLNYSKALFLPLWSFPFAISLNDNWLSDCSHSFQGPYLLELFNDLCVFASIECFQHQLTVPIGTVTGPCLITVSHSEIAQRCAHIIFHAK